MLVSGVQQSESAIHKHISTLFYYFIFIFGHTAAWGTLVAQPGIKPTLPALEAQSLNHWTTREIPRHSFLDSFPI